MNLFEMDDAADIVEWAAVQSRMDVAMALQKGCTTSRALEILNTTCRAAVDVQDTERATVGRIG